MKILRISLRNIASLGGTHTVDFTRDPLRSAGLFSISGITGSGKSTLLDALCLALYERTPRLNAVRSQARLNDHGDAISQKDPGNLLRRGTAEGFAEVAFVGVDGATYTARWMVRRARNRPEGSLQNPEMTLFRGDVPPGVNGTIEQGGKRSEVLPAIAVRVGLSFEQFTRAVLLAQNDFATFLKADDRERAEILQALTGTVRFENISVAVFDRFSREQKAVQEIEARLSGNLPLNPEQRAEAEVACARADAAWNEANEKLRVREAHAEWFRQLAKLSRQAAEAAGALAERISARDASAPRRSALQWTEMAAHEARPLRDTEQRLRAELALAEKTWDAAVREEEATRVAHATLLQQHAASEKTLNQARAAFENARQPLLHARMLDAKLQPLLERLTAAVRDREAAETHLRKFTGDRDVWQERRATAEKELAGVESRRLALGAYAPFSSEAKTWLHRLDHAQQRRDGEKSAVAAVQAKEKDEAGKERAVLAEQEKEAALRKAAGDSTAALDRAEGALKEYDADKLARARQEADAARMALRELRDHLRELEALNRQTSATELELKELKEASEVDAKALASLREKQIPEAGKAAEAARRSFDLAEAAVANEAIRLREKLVVGESCPVCGAKEHPHTGHPPALEAVALRALRAAYQAKDQEVRELEKAAAHLDAARAARLKQEAAQEKALAELKKRLDVHRDFHPTHPAAVAILELPAETRVETLAMRLEQQQRAVESAEAAETARRAAEKLRKDCQAQRNLAAAALAAHEKRAAELSKELAALRAARESAQSVQAEAAKAGSAALWELAALFGGIPEWHAAWERDPAAFRSDFAEQTASFLSLEVRRMELQASIRESEAALGPAREAVARGEAEANAKRMEETKMRSECEAIRTERAKIFAGRAADEVERELAGALRLATEDRDMRAGELEKSSQRLAACAERRSAAGQLQTESANRLKAAISALETWIEGFAQRCETPLDRAALEVMLARDGQWIQNERAALDAMEGAVRNAEGALAVCRQTVEMHNGSRPTADDEPTVAADLTSLKAAGIEAGRTRDAVRATLHADDQRLRDNAMLTTQLSERRALAEPWVKLNELIGSADGAKFRGIAQRRTLDILLGYANAQLNQLTPRYRLERISESLNLVVIDRDMGDERRSVHSLSGGESFLVSLALALALASLTSNRLRIESLFIDEGFGSLDPETLGTAMNALMHLEAQGRKVGVISHVTEMTDAIPVQIRVVKGRSGASRLIVPGAPAMADESAEESNDGPSITIVTEIAGRLLEILRRENAVGNSKVSTQALRKKLGCEKEEFDAARTMLDGQVVMDGRSLMLAT